MTDIQQLIRDGRALLEKETKGPPNLYGTLYAFARNNLPALLDALETAQTENVSLQERHVALAEVVRAIRTENRLLRRVADAAQALIDEKVNRSGFNMDHRSLDSRLLSALRALPASTEGET